MTMQAAPWRKALVIYFVVLAIYVAASNRRLLGASFAPHFVYQAHAWLHGRLALEGDPPNQEDWARIDGVALRDGRQLRGQLLGPTTFVTLAGERMELDPSEIVSRRKQWYVSFPPFPAVVFLPIVAIAGLATNDVLVTVLLAPIAPALLFLLLGLLRRRGYSHRSETEDLWLTAMLALGSVYFYSSLSGGVWYTAHIIAASLTVAYLYFSLEAAHPAAAGLALVLGFATRTPLLLLAPWFLLEAWRCRRPEWIGVVMRFCMPIAIVGVLLALFNYVRFANPFEFGHTYLTVRWAGRIARHGLFNYHFLPRNLAAALTLLPKFLRDPPYIQTSRHGLSLLVTTPPLGYLLWPKDRSPLARGLWLAVAPVALASLLYQNDGWIQFGYRFSLDYMMLLVLLLAVGGRSMGALFRTLILIGVVVNLFGALTFDQTSGRYFYDGFFPAE